jgi:hypothetical protein
VRNTFGLLVSSKPAFQSKENTMPDINKLIAYEEGALDDQETIDFFQDGIGNGWVWELQGHYGRTAQSLIDLGFCTTKGE